MKRPPLAALASASAVALACVATSGAGPARAAACVNEALRIELGSGALPDCRAYEQITPAYKQGFELYALGYARDGETAMLESYGALAGTVGDSEGGLTGYAARRTLAGWQTESLNPPQAAYPGQSIRAANADTGASLWELHSASQSPFETELYGRSVAGVWSRIGPLFSPAEAGGEAGHTTSSGLNRAIAATADYGHVIVATRAQELDVAGHALRWPFDTSKGSSRSLYEYAGTNNAAPVLVAVAGQKGSTNLIGVCGAVLGSGEVLGGSTFNAMSADGETIFLTPFPEDLGAGQCVAPSPAEPAVAEVYARVGGAPSSPRAAQTIDVSARSTLSCDAKCMTSVPADKLFEAASEDGSHVVFASTQALIAGASEDTVQGDGAISDERGAGCARTSGAGGCNLYQYDLTTHTLSLIAGGAEVVGLARMSPDGSHVYFVARGALEGTAHSGGGDVQAAPTAGQPNLYAYSTATRLTEFVATLNPEADGEDWRAFDQRPVQASAGEGRFLLFPSRGVRLTQDDSGLQTQLFEYDSLTGELDRVSKGEVVAGEQVSVERGEKGELGYEENGNAVAGSVSSEALSEGASFHGEDFHQRNGGTTTYVSPDGAAVVFASTGRLSPLAVSAQQQCTSVYRFRTGGPDAPLSSGRVSLVSDGQDVQPLKGQACVGGQLLAMDPSAQDILFSTADPLLSSDTDGLQRDIYDARIGGGFSPVGSPSTCEADACHGPLTPAPTEATLATRFQPAEGDAAAKASPLIIRILARARRGRTLEFVLRSTAAGQIVISGRGIRTARRRVSAGRRYTVRVALSGASLTTLRHRRAIHLAVTVALHASAGSTTAASTIWLRG